MKRAANYKLSKILLVVILGFSLIGGEAMAQLDSKRVVMVIAETNFRDEELFEPKSVLEKEGVRVDIASTSISPAKGKLGAIVNPDLLLSDINIDNYDAIVFIGGSGSMQYFNDQRAHSFAREAVTSGKMAAAICIAPAILANAGLLNGKNATVFSSEADTLRKNGAFYTKAGVEIDGNIITANGPQSATKFGEAILEALSK